MTSIISEFHSVTYRCKSTAVHISGINIRKNNDMAPQQHDTLPKSSDIETKEPPKSSPVSNLGTSVDSSPPLLPNQEASANISEYETGRTTVYDPSSDDSGSIQSNFDDQDEFHQSPLEQLQCAFGKNGMLPQSSPLSNYSPEKNRNCLPQGYRDVHDDNFQSTPSGTFNRNMPSTSSGTPMFDRDSPFMSSGLDLFPQPVPCHSCSYVATSKQEYDAHTSEHFEHKCTQCNYASRTEGRLKRHINDYHSDVPPESWSGSKTKKKIRSNSEESMENCVTSSNGKSRKFKCKHCTFECGKKDEFWKHAKIHMKPDKILQCPHCDFASEFKHHYEYHIANHFGRKPFKCSMCNYKCVNKSMLNSHMKSHSNVYQFRCATCSYVTKYCHSIKQHLKTKQGHEAGPILNQDGTPSSIQMIDVYGRRRGPRTKKRKTLENPPNNVVSSSSAPPSQQIMPYSAPVPMLPPAIYPSMDYAPNFFMGTTHQLNPGYSMHIPLPSVHLGRYECSVCRYVTNDLESLNRHIITHAGEYPDIAKLYGINPEVLPSPQAFSNMMRQRNYLDQMESSVEKSFSPRHEKVSSSHGIRHGEKHQCDEGELEARSIKSEERSSPDYHRHLSSSPRNEGDSFKDFSSPSPTHSTVSLPDFLASHKKQENAKGGVIVSVEASSNIEVDSYSRPKGDDSPIDLSSPKSDSPKSDKSKALDVTSEQQSSEIKTLSPRGPESANITSTNRHRRKGKAFKIDHYMQYDEQQELLKKESGEAQFIGSFKDDTMEGIEQLWTEKVGQIQNPEADIVSEKQPAEFHRPDTSNRVYSSPQEQRIPPNQRKIQQIQSLNIMNGNHQNLPSTSSNTEDNRLQTRDISSHNELTLSVNVDDTGESSLLDSPVKKPKFKCSHCPIGFGDWILYSIHMGFHAPHDPFTCKSCGCVTKDATSFFIHLIRDAH